MAPYTGHLPCAPYPYVTPEEVLLCCSAITNEIEGPDDPRLTDAVEDATEIIYYLTGKQFVGTCTATERPCIPCGCSCGGGTGNYYMANNPLFYLNNWPWLAPCDCCTPNQIKLDHWPVTNILSVTRGGITIDDVNLLSELYHIDEYSYLVANDNAPFPSCGNMFEPLDEDLPYAERPPFSVTVEYGMQVPGMVRRATRTMACQLVRQCLDLDCQIPKQATSMIRSGVSYELENVIDYLSTGRTGIYEVDLCVRTFNPSLIQSPAFIWTPDMRYGRNTYTNR